MPNIITIDLTPVPSRQSPDTFSERMDTFLSKLPAWAAEANALAVEAGENAGDAEAAAILAVAAQEVADSASALAVGAANFKGNWASLAGPLSIPASVAHGGYFWILLANLPDVTASEPTLVNSDWQVFDFLPSRSGNSGKVLTNDGTTDSWTATLTGMTLKESAYAQVSDASLGSGTHTFDYLSGDMQQLTATGDITLAFSGFPTGKVASMVIDAVNWGAHTITHPAGILFEYSVAPIYTTSGKDRLVVIKDKNDTYSLFVLGQSLGAA